MRGRRLLLGLTFIAGVVELGLHMVVMDNSLGFMPGFMSLVVGVVGSLDGERG